MKLISYDTETIDKLYLELSQFTKAKTKNDLMLEQLIMAVSQRHPGESRFETVLRYIQQAENQNNGPAKSNI